MFLAYITPSKVLIDLLKIALLEARQMAQQVGALAVLAEDACSVPSIHIAAPDHLDRQSQGSNALFWPMWALHPCEESTI